MSSHKESQQSKWKSLEPAVRRGNISQVSSILDDNPNLAAAPGPHSLLHSAVDSEGNCTSLLRKLLDAGVPPNTQSLATIGALHLAAKKSCFNCMKQLLDAGADVNLKDIQDRTPLFYAVNNNRDGSGQCIQLLLEKGSSVNDVCEGRITPLHVAAEVGNVTAAQLLLKAGASHDARDKDGCTPLHLATTSGMVEALLAGGAEVTVKDNALQTPLERVIQFYPTVAQTLLDAGVEVRGNPQEKDLRVFFHLNTVTGGSSPCEVDLLDKIENYGHYDLLKHPLCEIFLHLKWYHVQPLFYMLSILRVVMIVSLTLYLTFQQRVERKGTEYAANCSVWSNGLDDLLSDENLYIVITSTRVLALLLVALLIVWDVIKYFSFKLQFWRRMDSPITIVFFVCSAAVLIAGYDLSSWKQHFGTVALLTGWLQVTFILSHSPDLGIYIQLFKVVALRMTKFAVVYLPVFIGFSLCFRVTFDQSGTTFQTPLSSGIKALAMMSGELDYNSVLGRHDPIRPGTREIIFCFYVLLIAITTVNLLVGLAVRDIQVLMKKAGVNRLALTVLLEMQIDEFFNSRFASCFLLRPLKDMTSLLPSLTAKPLTVRRGSSRPRSTIANFKMQGQAAQRMIVAEKYYNVFICPNRTNDSGQVYRSLIPHEFSSEGFIERPAAFTLPPWIVRNTKLLINSDRFRRKVDGGEGNQTQEEASMLNSGSF
ncbi:transient receptor potential channel pyrexia-like [Penaeus chinensis]|uniref:transient receptor potential channel pyrexia-like n=1 Tax=Penaeus chinensis TaxID=139456 RepID=UPI001FB653C0|nr:transient receptor potential channel pyrexia-like [Penaeus chinensis]